MDITNVLPSTWQVPQVFSDRLGKQVGRQRAMQDGGHLLLVLHEPPRPDDNTRQGRIFWRDAAGQWQSNKMGSGVSAIQKHLAEYNELIAQIDSRLDEANTAEEFFQLIRQLGPLQRSAANQHSVLQHAREMFKNDRQIIDLRDQAYEIHRTLELMFQEGRMGLDYAIARRAEEQSEHAEAIAGTAHRLNLLAAFFFPLAALSAIFGMNLHSGLEREDLFPAFWFLLIFGILSGVFLYQYVVQRQVKLKLPKPRPKLETKKPRIR